MKDKKRAMIYVVIIGVTIVPILYSFFYLKSCWDPYANMKNIPVAFVNLDNGKDGTNRGNELIDSIKDKEVLDICVTDRDESKQGLINKKYYATITIPKDFTKNIESAATQDRQTAIIEYMPNQKSNYLASKMIDGVVSEIQNELKSTLNVKIISYLGESLLQVPEKLTEMQNGMSALADGSSQLEEGSKELNNGVLTLASNYTSFNDGISSVNSGSNQLNSAITEFDKAIGQLKEKSDMFGSELSKLDQLKDGINTLYSNYGLLAQSLNSYVNGVNETADSMIIFADFIINAGDSDPSLMQNPNFQLIYNIAQGIKQSPAISDLKNAGQQISQASQKINLGLGTLNQSAEKLSELPPKVSELHKAIGQLKDASEQISYNMNRLNSGVNLLSDNSAKIKDGMATLESASKSLADGADTLNNGINTASSEINSQIDSTNHELAGLKGLDDYAKNPIEISKNEYNTVSSYGIGLTPYFISLGLWVGSIILLMVLYYDPDDRFKILGRNATNRFKRTICYFGLGVAQAVVLGVVLKLSLGYEVLNTFNYYFSLILISTAFVSIVEFLIVAFGDVGKFLSILILIIQLSASGGLFPIETTPAFFRAMYNFMPIKYSIALLRESLISTDDNFILMNSMVLIGIIILFSGGLLLIDLYKKLKSKDTAQA